ncbi:membrane protein [Klebsiella sp. RIT-PI-d]|uniref:hypothetical protein n=1 Tax=Klebsiella sp. RIT-PI-d TaxID=1681196 RepID=UPI0006760ECD|nr:hypothetical protein [Klebsiella sp. RIT-PI-d]KNC12986.1 membrane protein [Klebsiella sp. RIT-PI-d]
MLLADSLNTLLTPDAPQPAGFGAAAAEFITLLDTAMYDEDEGIRKAGSLIVLALREKERGWLTDDDLRVLLEGQRDIARLRANNAEIPLRSRIQSVVIRLIDITLASLIAAL